MYLMCGNLVDWAAQDLERDGEGHQQHGVDGAGLGLRGENGGRARSCE